MTLVARVCQDVFGDRALAGLQREGLIAEHITIGRKASLGVPLISVDAARENSIAVAPGANALLSPDGVHETQEAIESTDVLLLQLDVPMETVLAAAKTAHEARVQVILNPAAAASNPLLAELLPKANILAPNGREVALLTGTQTSAKLAARRLAGQGAGAVVVTLGARRASVVTRDTQRFMPSSPVDAVDTTATGDAFCGGLAVALCQRRPLPRQCASPTPVAHWRPFGQELSRHCPRRMRRRHSWPDGGRARNVSGYEDHTDTGAAV